MSSISSHAAGAAHAGHEHAHDHAHNPTYDMAHVDLSEANTRMPAGWGKVSGIALLLLGAVLSIATLVPAFTSNVADESGAKLAKHAISAYHTGFIVMLTMTLGPLGLVMIFHLVKAGWAVTIRRQLENMAALVPAALIMFTPIILATVIVKQDILFKWMSPALLATDPLLVAKSPFLNATFFYIRLAIYFAIWLFVAMRLNRLSREQDTSGNKDLTVRAGLTSAWGILAFALSLAFASFDLIKSLDFHWFSTMFGVYIFAGSMVAAVATLVLTLAVIRGQGRLKGLVTSEHLHDLGKLLLAFTIFWAYVNFSQYFLIWYANIPEETAWYMLRTNNGWQYLGIALILLHFVVPFLLLLWRGSKRSIGILAVAAVLLLAMHCVDIFYCIRPIVYMGFESGGIIKGKVGYSWMDLTGILGPVLVFVGLLIRKIGSGPLIPMQDPRLPEDLGHKNYI